MPKKKTTWIAKVGKYSEEFSTKKEAVEAEEYKNNQKITKLSVVFRKYFKTHYKTNDFQKYLYLCVDCGKKILEYDCYYDGHRNEKGDIIFQDKEAVELFDGKRCKKCNKKAEKLFEKILLYSEKSENINTFNSTTWKSFYYKKMDRKTLLYILEIIDYYDKRPKKKKKQKIQTVKK